MAAFALVFVPPWVAFRFAHGWRRTLAWSAGLGLVAYLVAFVAAIRLDQPFGPVLVAALLLVALGEAFRPCLTPAAAASPPRSGSPRSS